MDFKIGDVVQLKSGGPEMTINKIIGVNTEKMEDFAYKNSGHKDGDIVCQWFYNNKLETAIFKPETLDLVEEE